VETAENKLRRMKVELFQTRNLLRQRELAQATMMTHLLAAPQTTSIHTVEREKLLSEAMVKLESRVLSLRSRDREAAKTLKEHECTRREAEEAFRKQQEVVYEQKCMLETKERLHRTATEKTAELELQLEELLKKAEEKRREALKVQEEFTKAWTLATEVTEEEMERQRELAKETQQRELESLWKANDEANVLFECMFVRHYSNVFSFACASFSFTKIPAKKKQNAKQ
jgi:hypothetical protein